ncbi:MAG TPA: heme lyase CcmF/NrfE family subunit [Abditibacteriaceae bacterium]
MLLSGAAAIHSIVATFFAFRSPEPRRTTWLDSAHHATVAMWVAMTGSAAVLMGLFVNNDFSLPYISGHSSKAQPLAYKVSALWAGQGGSLLLWAWILAVYSVLVAHSGRRDKTFLTPTATAIINVVAVFFVSLIVLTENPFKTVTGAIPADGRGLNPLLQNYWMQIHPPTLYAGYVGCTIPFAFAMSALLHRRYDGDWLATVRRWTLWPWIILTLGIIMGGRWAYETLGWGGYWAWDPVENASLMPWLTGTAFLHSLMIQSRRGMLKSWNMTLVVLTFLLSIFGTFLTRSGVISSVHSFAESNIGPYFLSFLAVALVLSFGLVIWRRDDLVADTEFESPLSREGAFLLNNWILLGAAFAVLWGTVFPSISEAITGNTVSVGKPYFNRVMIPLGLVLLALTGIGPLMAWRKMSPRKLLQSLRYPIVFGIAAAPVFYYLSAWHTGAATAVCLTVFVTVAIVGEFGRGARARRNMTGESFGVSLGNLLLKNRQRYGGYIVHLGIVVLFVGFSGAAFDIVTEPIKLKPGEKMNVGEYTLTFKGLVTPKELDKEKEREVRAQVEIARNGKAILDRDGKPFALHPGVAFFKAPGSDNPEARAGQPPQQAGIPAIMSNPAHDLYLVMAEFTEGQGNISASVKAYMNPLVMWIWISCIFFIGGSALSLWPEPKRARAQNNEGGRADGVNEESVQSGEKSNSTTRESVVSS